MTVPEIDAEIEALRTKLQVARRESTNILATRPTPLNDLNKLDYSLVVEIQQNCLTQILTLSAMRKALTGEANPPDIPLFKYVDDMFEIDFLDEMKAAHPRLSFNLSDVIFNRWAIAEIVGTREALESYFKARWAEDNDETTDEPIDMNDIFSQFVTQV